MKTQPKTRKSKPEPRQRVTAATLADLTDYAPSTISAWQQDGTLKRGRDGLFDLLESLRAIAEHENARDNDGNAKSQHAEIAALRAELLRQRIIGAIHENKVAAGLVHGKEECCLSLTSIISVLSTELNGLPGLIAAGHPEIPGLRKSVEEVVDGMVKRTRRAMKIEPAFKCPACGVDVEQFIVEHRPTQPGEEISDPAAAGCAATVAGNTTTGTPEGNNK